MSQIQGISFDTSAAALGEIVPNLKLITVSDFLFCLIYFNGPEKDATTRMAVIQALGSAISMIWLVMTPFLGVCFILGESIVSGL